MEDLDFAIFNNYLNGQRQENGVFARFYDKWVKTGEMKANGMPEFIQKTYVEIKLKNSYDITDRPADEADMMRFAREYNQYLIKKQKTQNGTPLNMFAFLTTPQIEECDLKGIYTVEDLASLKEEQAESLNLKKEKQMAEKFLNISKDNVIIAENNSLKEEIEKLKEEIKALKETK